MSQNSLALLVHTHRIRQGLTQSEVARGLGATQGWLSKIETGRLEYGLGFEEAIRLAKILDLPLETLARECMAVRADLPVLKGDDEHKAERCARLCAYFELATPAWAQKKIDKLAMKGKKRA